MDNIGDILSSLSDDDMKALGDAARRSRSRRAAGRAFL